MGENRHRDRRCRPRWSWKPRVTAGTGGASAPAPQRRLRDQGRARQRRGQAAVTSTWEAPGGSEVRQGAAAVRARCRADRGQERGLAARPCVGAVQRWRGTSRCTDRSAGGCADWHAFADHSCASLWWSGRRGGSASAVYAMAQPWTTVEWAVRPARPNDPAASAPCRLVRRLRCGQVSLGSYSCPSARNTGEGRPGPLPGQTRVTRAEHAPGFAATSCPHALGKRMCTSGSMPVRQEASAACLLGKHGEECALSESVPT